MIWTPLTQKAYRIACEAHCGQSDRGGNPYIIHPCTMAAQMPNEEAAAAALLHDVLEDTCLTLDDLVEEGIPDYVLQAVIFLTRSSWPGLSYLEYVQNLTQNPIAVLVKKADLRHNMDLSRLGRSANEKDMSLFRRYERAMKILENC